MRILPIACFLSTVTFAQSYTVSVIPPPSGYAISGVLAINNSGQVAGNVISSNVLYGPVGQAFIGSPSGSTLIPYPAGWSDAYAIGINDLGQVTGVVNNSQVGAAVFGPSAPFIWTALGGTTTIPLPSGWIGAGATGINDAGQVVGNRLDSYGNSLQAFIGTASGLTLIPVPTGSSGAVGQAISSAGQVAGYVDVGSEISAFIGTTSGSWLVPIPSGFNSAIGVAITSSGQVVGTATNGSVWQAFIGTASAATALPFPTGTSFMTAEGINDAGVAVGYSTAGGWIWTASTGTQLLNTMVPAGWNITIANGISQNGRILAYGTYRGGSNQYVELIPMIPATPAPRTGFLVIAGLLPVFIWQFGGLAGWRRGGFDKDSWASF